MFLNTYEIVYILRPNTTEKVNLEIVSEYKNLIKKNGGYDICVQHRGRRHLSYNIKQYYDAIYVQMTFKGNGQMIGMIEKSMKFNEYIIRYLTTRQDKVIEPTITV
uniref:Small ribosomal subunit protein bS6c n=1 Tax=Izziella formosana TaxID=1653389 RepID=A0A1G4NUT5_9FLOR|nr:Ribosomal protein S6 [Izziella formosana]SCW22269.1 Ribosomal protein S6 [Izziella formosana]